MKGQAGAGEGRLDANMFIKAYNWLCLKTLPNHSLITHYNIKTIFIIRSKLIILG